MARDHIVDDLLHLRMRQVNEKLRGVESYFVTEGREHCECERNYAAIADELIRKRRFLDEMRDELRSRRQIAPLHTTMLVPHAMQVQSPRNELLEAILLQNSQHQHNMTQQLLISNMSRNDPPVIALPSAAPPYYAPARLSYANPTYTHRETYRSDPHSSRLVRYYLSNYTPKRSGYHFWN